MKVSRYHDISIGHIVSGHTGKCGQLHGHNIRVTVTFKGPIEKDGMVIDFAHIKGYCCVWLDRNWDHRFLVWDKDPIYSDLKKIDSTVVGVPFNPTAENMAHYLHKTFSEEWLWGELINSVSVRETEKCEAWT